MKFEFRNKMYDMPDADLRNYMFRLGLSKEDAIHTWLCDKGIDDNPEQDEVQRKAEQAQKERRRYERSAVSNKTSKTKAKKADTEKEELISLVYDVLQAEVDRIELTNKARKIDFWKNNTHFSFSLTRHKD